MDAARLIRSLRVRNGLTQAELAARARTSQPVVSAYEHGRRDPTIGTLRRFVAAAGERLVLSAAPVAGDVPPAADDAEHGRRLLDVLSLVDALPVRVRPATLDAPRLVSR
jgi:transcriptional regulator with XRE-family HTH domain